MDRPKEFAVRVTAVRTLSSTVRELSFERVDGAPMAFEAGQWVNLVLPVGGDELRRSYSIASPPSAGPTFQIAVTKVDGGPGSTYLHGVEPGAELVAIGPQGFFTRAREGDAPSLFVGTGTGVTPLRSMLLDALARGHERPLWLLFGVRDVGDRLYLEELEALAANHDNVRVEYTLSRPGEGWRGRSGYVQSHVVELWRDLASRGEQPHAFICGLHAMVGGVRDVLKTELSVPRQQVHSERYD